LTTDKFHPERYRDTYTDRLREAIEQKVAGQQVHVAQEHPTGQIIDLFEALKRSLNSAPAPDPAEPAIEARPPKKAEPRAQKRAPRQKTG
jgi:DNA end-binding protein Ku